MEQNLMEKTEINRTESGKKAGTKPEVKQGMITAVHRDRYEIRSREGYCCGRLKTANYYQNRDMQFPTVGDEVEFLENREGDSLITATLPRRSVFLRQNPTQGLPEQAAAANFDYVFLVMSLNHDFNLVKLTRYLAAAAKSGGVPVILLSKADLCGDTGSYLQEIRTLHTSVPVLTVSTVTGEGIGAVMEYLKPGKKAVFLGASGVGKSSLVNYLTGMEMMKTSGIREADSQGRHTTTHRQCFFLENGAAIIDTPGMRMVMLSGANKEQPDIFDEIRELMAACRFRNCTHTAEPGCAVQAALRAGTLDRKRYEEYKSLLREEAHAKGREVHRLKRLEKPGKYTKKDRKWQKI